MSEFLFGLLAVATMNRAGELPVSNQDFDSSLFVFDSSGLSHVDQIVINETRKRYREAILANRSFLETPFQELTEAQLDYCAALIHEEYLLNCYKLYAEGKINRVRLLDKIHRNLLFRGDMKQLWRRKRQCCTNVL